LMLARHQNGAARNIFCPAHFNMRAADHPQQPQGRARPNLEGANRPFTRG
jgi:hypothetical protein